MYSDKGECAAWVKVHVRESEVRDLMSDSKDRCSIRLTIQQQWQLKSITSWPCCQDCFPLLLQCDYIRSAAFFLLNARWSLSHCLYPTTLWIFSP